MVKTKEEEKDGKKEDSRVRRFSSTEQYMGEWDRVLFGRESKQYGCTKVKQG